MRAIPLLILPLMSLPAHAADPIPWRIDRPSGPTREVELQLDRGTWMGVDVHPDGDRLVFDLLGDLYLLPIEGGQATPLTSGPAWDTEARWSPSGDELVFTSDRGNNRNLWLMDSDGSRARALTSESRTRVSDASWAPDGQRLVARKRSTDRSSIGVHELWLFDRFGGKGVQLTKKEELGGVVEPAWSPDGEAVFFSARQARYSYARDPNEGIFQVRRLDVKTGRSRPLTGEFGGAGRPVPSPDGRTLATVRRVRDQTWLELIDLETGARTPLADWLDQDEQEGFAISGVYPRFDWLPDGQGLVVWAEGQLWRVSLDGQRANIPFDATVQVQLAEPVRSPRSPASERVQAKLLRWPVLAPGGDLWAFSALGSIWTQELPGGAPERLSSAEHREYAPAWSPDGRWLCWVSWDDVAGGALHVQARRGGRSFVLGRAGPKYSNPSFSPDGREIVLLRGSGAAARGHDLGRELWQEIVILGLDGGEQVVGEVAGLKRAGRPRFSADGARILFPEERPTPLEAADGVVTSINRDGSDRRTVLEIGQATDAVVSPDGGWVAFQEAHHAWIGKLPRTGEGPLSIAHAESAVPVWRLSEEAGDWVDFSADGRFVTWNHGPELRRLELATLLGWQAEQQEAARVKAELAAEAEDEGSGEPGGDEGPPDGARAANGAEEAAAEPPPEPDEDEPPLPPSEAFEVDLSLPRGAPAGAVAIVGARVITMRGDEVLESATVLTRDDRIVAVGADVVVPADAHVVDGRGTTIVPGFIDVHAHLHFSAVDTMQEQDWRYLANLAYGVTTVHDPSAFSDQAFAFGELVEAGRMLGPRVFSTGQILYGASGSFRSEVASLEDARRHVRRLKQLGAVSVKSYQQPRRDQRQWLLQAGREEGLLVVPEGGGDLLNNLNMVLDGHSAIEHALPVAPVYDDVVQLFARSGVFYSPTLLVAYGGLAGEFFFYAREPVWANERLLAFTPQGVVDRRARRLTRVAPDDDWHHMKVARSAAAIQRAGGRVTVGGHGQLQGLGTHWEIQALAGPGAMTPHEALRSATIHGAAYLGMEADLGSIEAGKLADFVVLERNPLDDIANTDSVRQVVKNGALYDAATLDRVWPAPEAAPPLLWQVARGDLEGGCAGAH